MQMAPVRETLPSLSLSPWSGALFRQAPEPPGRATDFRGGLRSSGKGSPTSSLSLPWAAATSALLLENHPAAPLTLLCRSGPWAQPGPGVRGHPCSLLHGRRCGGSPALWWSCGQGLQPGAAAPSGEGADKQRPRSSGKSPPRVKGPERALQGPRHLAGPVVPQGAGPRSGELRLGTLPGPRRHAHWHRGPGRSGGGAGPRSRHPDWW